MSKFICFLFVVLLFQSVDAQQPQQPQQQNRRQQRTITVERIMEQLPEGVTFIPDIAYREGNEAWKLDLAMPTERGDTPRPALVFIHGGEDGEVGINAGQVFFGLLSVMQLRAMFVLR